MSDNRDDCCCRRQPDGTWDESQCVVSHEPQTPSEAITTFSLSTWSITDGVHRCTVTLSDVDELVQLYVGGGDGLWVWRAEVLGAGVEPRKGKVAESHHGREAAMAAAVEMHDELLARVR
jgi:hypothetical protein